jgi:glycerol-3-phosphate acyltransferase PlsY
MVIMTGVGWTISIVCAYFAGSIPFGVLLARSKGVNIREHGSKNIGATNVGRVLGKKIGLVCFILDVLKGVVPVLIVGVVAELFGQSIHETTTTEMLLWICVALAALLGHMYSIFLKFGGGKGVATTFGGMVAMWPLLTIPVLLAFLAWGITLKATKMISLASLVAAFVLFGDAVATVLLGSSLAHAWPLLAVTGLILAMVYWKHRSNIGRIIRGDEPKVGTETK